MKLSVGCGKLKKEGSVNLDQFFSIRPDIVSNMTEGLPFRTGSFEHVDAIACLGQIERNKDFLTVMNELHRVLQDNGWLFVQIPDMNHQHCYMDPFNQRRTNDLHWQSFDGNSRQWINHNSYYGFLPFKNVEVRVDRGFLLVHMAKPTECEVRRFWAGVGL